MRSTTFRSPVSLLPVSALFVSLVGFTPAIAADLIIVNSDGPGEGLNDPAARLPVGGNTGTTLGEQRLIALQYAADRWGDVLRSQVPIHIDARFNPMGGDALSAPIGFADANSSHRDFIGAPEPHTFYVAALANRLARMDLQPNDEDMRVRMNSDVDGLSVLGPRTFYYGLDGQPGADIDFVTAALHEFAHGLGFLPLANLDTGALMACSAEPTAGCSDAYVDQLRDETIDPPQLGDMVDGQRSAAARNEPDLVWSGASARGASVGLTQGADSEDRIVMHAPADFVAAVSVTHVTTSAAPDQLMEPSYSGANHELELAALMLRDTGWSLTSDTTTTTSTSLPPQSQCGDPSADGNITSTDALIVLNAAVDLVACALSVCDVDAGGTITSTDAVRVLKFAVGEDVALICP